MRARPGREDRSGPQAQFRTISAGRRTPRASVADWINRRSCYAHLRRRELFRCSAARRRGRWRRRATVGVAGDRIAARGSPEADAFRVAAFRQGLKETDLSRAKTSPSNTAAPRMTTALARAGGRSGAPPGDVVAAIGNAASRAAKRRPRLFRSCSRLAATLLSSAWSESGAAGRQHHGHQFLGGSLRQSSSSSCTRRCPGPPSSPCS